MLTTNNTAQIFVVICCKGDVHYNCWICKRSLE